MAKTIATVSGVALAPGVSRNGRLYTREAIAKAIVRAQGRLADGETVDLTYRDEPMTQLTHHAAEDDSSRIVGRITSLSLGEDGKAHYSAAIADTPHGHTIANLLDTSDGQPPFLKGVSIRGAWLGKVRRIKGPDGSAVETADDLELDGLDYTRKPGVPGAGVETFAWARDGANETTERVLITESAEACVTTLTEETAPVSEVMPADVREATRELLPLERPHLLANGLCETCTEIGEAATVALSKRSAGLQGKSGTTYADPGYQPDKKQRYELDTKAHVRAAWSFISQASNAKLYTPAQLKRIKGRIKAAAGKFGITIATEGWTIDPALQLTEAVTEFYGGDPETAGSYTLTASNGPTTVTVCSYGLDPADLAVILQKACDGAGSALASLDPDMDGDIDVPGADAEDTDGDMNGDGIDDLATRLAAAFKGESGEDPKTVLAEAFANPPAAEAAPAEPPAPDAGPHTETEDPAMGETTTQEAVVQAPAAAPAVSVPEDLVARYQKKLAKKEAKKRLAAAKPAESAPAAPVAETTTETADERIARLVEEKVTAKLAETAVTETEDQRIERLVSERLVAEKQGAVAGGGGPGRKGLVTEHTAARTGGEIPEGYPMKDGVMKPMEQWTEDERRVAGAVLQQHVLGDRAVY
jgi:hypothetical protein